MGSEMCIRDRSGARSLACLRLDHLTLLQGHCPSCQHLLLLHQSGRLNSIATVTIYRIQILDRPCRVILRGRAGLARAAGHSLLLVIGGVAALLARAVVDSIDKSVDSLVLSLREEISTITLFASVIRFNGRVTVMGQSEGLA